MAESNHICGFVPVLVAFSIFNLLLSVVVLHKEYIGIQAL